MLAITKITNFLSSLPSKNLKIKMCKIIILVVILYGFELGLSPQDKKDLTD